MFEEDELIIEVTAAAGGMNTLVIADLEGTIIYERSFKDREKLLYRRSRYQEKGIDW